MDRVIELILLLHNGDIANGGDIVGAMERIVARGIEARMEDVRDDSRDDIDSAEESAKTALRLAVIAVRKQWESLP